MYHRWAIVARSRLHHCGCLYHKWGPQIRLIKNCLFHETLSVADPQIDRVHAGSAVDRLTKAPWNDCYIISRLKNRTYVLGRGCGRVLL